MQRVLVREVQVAYRVAERRACWVLGFSRTTTATGAGVIRGPSFEFDFEIWRPVGCNSDIRGSGCSCVGNDGS